MKDSRYNNLKNAASRFNPLRFLSLINAPARSSIFFTASNVIAKAAALVFTPFYTRLLTTEEYGTYSLFLTYLSIITVIGTLEMGGSVIMRAFQKHRNMHSTVILIGFLISIFTTLASLFGLFVTKRALGAKQLFGGSYALLAISAICASLINLFSARSRFLYKPAFSILLTVLQSIVTPILSISLISFEAMKEFNHVAVKVGTATVISAVIALTVLAILIPKSIHEMRVNKKNGIEKEITRLLLRLSVPMLPYYLSLLIISHLDKIFISEFLGRDILGMYSISYAAGIAPVCITGGILGALCPWVMRKVRAKNTASVRTTLSTVTSLLCAVIICFLSAMPEILKILAPGEYLGAAPVAFVIALCPIPLFITQLTSGISIAYEKPKLTVISAICAAGVSLTLCILLIPVFGVLFAALSTLTAYLLLAALGVLNSRRITGDTPIYINKTLRSMLITALLSAAIYQFRSEIFIRIIIGALAFICIIYMLLGSKRLLKEREEAAQESRA